MCLGGRTVIRLFLGCALIWVCDTTCQIRLQTSDFIPIAGPRRLGFGPANVWAPCPSTSEVTWAQPRREEWPYPGSRGRHNSWRQHNAQHNAAPKSWQRHMVKFASTRKHTATGGPSPRSRYATPPPPLQALRAHLVTKGQWLLTIHMVAPKAPEFFFFIPLAHVASLPAQALEHPNAILEPNLDSNAHPNPNPNSNQD